MKQFALSLLLVWPLILGFFQRFADASTTDYALMSATPYYSEIALARWRLEKFLYKQIIPLAVTCLLYTSPSPRD